MLLKGINTALLSAAILFSGAASALPDAANRGADGNGRMAELYATIDALSTRVAKLEAESGTSESLNDMMSGSTFRMYWRDSEVGAGWTTVGMGTGYIVLNSDGTFAYPRFLKAMQNNGTDLSEVRSFSAWDLSVQGEWVVDESSSSLALNFHGDDGMYTPGEDQRFWYQVSHNGTVLMSGVLDDNADAGYFFTQYVAGVRIHNSASLHDSE
ncbi:hypothetical protein [Microbulbifer yueqingensis]|uniref:Outer membrane lipoprotein-sorting protein n=1 Tax=Microbulbifer yueqingensis TaxID=658219 RepID=A0A1G9DF71_9GAMM|nr:hypothetical protein [Microbulbifer yueqingensis]SDK62497.1 hypothetical protein SAMN05216212_2776 [Microbulbifer yueqingensis]